MEAEGGITSSEAYASEDICVRSACAFVTAAASSTSSSSAPSPCPHSQAGGAQ